MTTPQPVSDALALFGTLLDEMEELTGAWTSWVCAASDPVGA